MTFTAFINDYIRDSIIMENSMSIISLINTLNQCDDVNAISIDNNMYDRRTYAINVYTVSNPITDLADYVIWYQYTNDKYEIVITGVRDRRYNYIASNCNDNKVGLRHNFQELEIKYLV